MVKRVGRGPDYDESRRRRARQLYQVDGIGPSVIASRSGGIPVDTVKGWLRGLKRGIAATEEVDLPLWDFADATPVERKVISPLFNMIHRDTDDETGEEVGFRYWKDPEDDWPPQDVGDWFVRLRQLGLEKSADGILLDARFIAMLERRIGGATATAQDIADYRATIADYLRSVDEMRN